MTDLRKATGGTVGTFMALSTILGSGMMILPGTSYHELARAAWMPWAVAAVSVVPLLYCYAWLGRHHPSASGVAHYSEVAFGPSVGRASGLLAVGALLTGIPATAITGGRYVAEFSGAGYLAWLFPLVVLVGATLVAALGANVSGRLQVALILALFALVLAMTVLALGRHGVPAPGTALPGFGAFGAVLTAVYVAFTGWETVAFTFEEHRRPDLIPRIFAASYVIVVVLYGLLLFGLFASAGADDPALDQAPLLITAEAAFGALGRPITLLLVAATITANVVASVLALSRLVFGMARGGHLPRGLSRMRERDGNPVVAVFAVGTVLTLIALLQWTGLVPFAWLFILSGGIYFVLYGIGAASYGRLATGAGARAVTVLCAVTVLAVTLVAGPPMWLCWAVFAVVCLGMLALSRRPAAMLRERVR
ncbi:APC family permease [Actinoplanes teichomyceticus]|uniref:Amino acid efflux transporter n=1 Tax=Actinoplanes teichomyceticus TaxID=1867 RepID=A0A561WK22_ACTTI|nr:APC family permease [Actinoplanes teichomyceticus]TWG24198.1 amino acid efflux transporter [Actinoplanes teichomyceticus]GIF12955.1 amino acid transporter [Actinoplanes teichomyceticus]